MDPSQAAELLCMYRYSAAAAAAWAIMLLLLFAAPASGAAPALHGVDGRLHAAASQAAAADEASLKEKRCCTLQRWLTSASSSTASSCSHCMNARLGHCKAAWPAILADKLNPGACTAA